MTPCPDEATILAFGRGEGDPATRRLVELHMTECDECRALVGAVVRSSSMLPVAGRIDPIAPTTPVTPSGGPPAIGAATAAATPIVAPVKPGDVLAGKYVVERVLGAGGMGVVVAVRHLQLDQRFALKFLLPAAMQAPDAVARFLREGKAAARITSEHVARVVDTGVLDTGAPYLVLEYLEGADLGAQSLPLSVEDSVEYVLQACEAIVEAHQLGIVHRDLKPANLFLARRKDGSPLVKVLDFGISKADGDANQALTSSATMMGSPRYMSPEQMLSAKDVDARTDVWALGVILFELVSGRPVWDADTVQGLCALIATAPAPSVRTLAPGAPALLDEAISRCLAKDRAQRLPSVADLATMLAPLANAPAQTSIDRILRVAGRSRSVPIPKPPPTLSHGPGPGASTPALSQTPSKPSRAPGDLTPSGGSGRTVLALGAVIALIGLGAGGALFLRRSAPPTVVSAAAASSSPPVALPTPAASIEPVLPVATAPAVPSMLPSSAPVSPVVKRGKSPRPPPPAAAPAAPPAPPSPSPEPDRAMTERK